jgi:hypothetical protein
MKTVSPADNLVGLAMSGMAQSGAQRYVLNFLIKP